MPPGLADLKTAMNLGDGSLAQWVKVLATRTDDLSSTPKIHTMEGEN